jgi:hypothetical protein
MSPGRGPFPSPAEDSPGEGHRGLVEKGREGSAGKRSDGLGFRWKRRGPGPGESAGV